MNRCKRMKARNSQEEESKTMFSHDVLHHGSASGPRFPFEMSQVPTLASVPQIILRRTRPHLVCAKGKTLTRPRSGHVTGSCSPPSGPFSTLKGYPAGIAAQQARSKTAFTILSQTSPLSLPRHQHTSLPFPPPLPSLSRTPFCPSLPARGEQVAQPQAL